ncbi:MAG: starvation-inducible protein [Idiomarina sp.]|nr:starvation-inducible protein [Idiomarina sp.]
MRMFQSTVYLKWVAVAAGVFMLAGCASRYPEPIRTEATDLVGFSEAQRQGEAVQGRTARWGGVIANVQNTEQRSRLEVVNFRLNNFGRPQAGDDTAGRFVVYVNEFLDPEIYQRGRLITALGEFTGTEQGQIGDFNYYYPVLQATGVELWRPQQSSPGLMHPAYGYYDPHSLWYRNYIYGVGPYRYYHDPFYRPWGHRPVRVIQQRPHPQQPPAQQRPRGPEFEAQGVSRPRQQQH